MLGAVLCCAGKLEWASHDLSTIFVQRKNLASPSFLRMIRDVLRFGAEAPKVLDPEQAHVFRDMTLAQYLDKFGYSDAFRFNYVLPMCAAVWSVPNATVSKGQHGTGGCRSCYARRVLEWLCGGTCTESAWMR